MGWLLALLRNRLARIIAFVVLPVLVLLWWQMGGAPGTVVKEAETSGVVAQVYKHAYLITLDSVQMGPIELKNVEASVVDNPTSPQYPLVGMSFLGQLEMDSIGGVLRLKQTR